jgi:tRNA A-37 threonylcarbamoyl transferase component Bud32/tetratricopeptide (TPR) repeat protein
MDDGTQSLPPPAARNADLLVRGATIGRYIVVGLLGRGGMGDVYGAYDPELDRKVAIKLVRTHRDKRISASDGRSRLLREAQAIAKLSHPNVVGVYDVGTFEDSVFITMELIEGHTVGYWLQQAPRTWREILAIFQAAGRGLAAAHRAGMVHRDFKPDNVMVTRDGEVRVMDFGLASLEGEKKDQNGWAARAAAATAPDADIDSTIPLRAPTPEPDGDASSPTNASLLESKLTETGVLLGTPAYMAPEQFGGKVTSARADQFSFCVSLYESLYGQRPFAGKTVPELMTSVLAGAVLEPPADTDVPGWLRRTILRGLSREPPARYARMEDLLAALAHDPARIRRRWLTAIGAVLMTGALVTATVLGWRASHSGANLCARGADKLLGVWEGSDTPDSARKKEIGHSFSETGVSYAAASFASVRQILDHYVDAWKGAYRATCEATHVRGEQSAEVLDLRMSCLSERLGRVRALVELFTQASPKVVENAVGAASALPALDRCDDVKLLRSITPVPDDPVVRARVDALQKDLAHVRVLGDSGQCAAAATAGRKLTAEAKAIGYLPLVAESLNAFGRSATECMSADEAILTHRQAILAGATSHDEDAAVEAMILLAHIQADRSADVAQGRVWIDLAEATLQGMNGAHPVLEAWRLESLGRISSKEGKPEEALKILARAKDLVEKTEGPDHPDVANVTTNMGLVLQEMNRLEEALAAFRQAENLADKVLGPDHPLVAMSLTNEGEVLNALHRFDEARSRLVRAADIWHRTGSSPNYLAWTLIRLGEALLDLGRSGEARARLEEGIKLFPDDHDPMLPAARFALARALWTVPAERSRAVGLARAALAASSRGEIAPPREPIDVWLRDHVVR